MAGDSSWLVAEWSTERGGHAMNRTGGIGILGVIVIVVVILFILGVIKV